MVIPGIPKYAMPKIHYRHVNFIKLYNSLPKCGKNYKLYVENTAFYITDTIKRTQWLFKQIISDI